MENSEPQWEETTPDLYQQKSNFFPVNIEAKGKVYRVAARYEGEYQPGIIRSRDLYLTLSRTEGAVEVTPEITIIRDFLARHFISMMREGGFRFKGLNNSKCFSIQKHHPDSYENVFKIFETAFNYRFMIRDGKIMLVIDPCVVISVTASVQALHKFGVPIDKLKDFYVSYKPGIKNIDGYLIVTKVEKDGSTTCSVKNGESFEIESIDGSKVRPEGRPELIQEFLNSINIKINLVNLHQGLSFLRSNKASFDRLDKTYKIAQYLASKIFPIEFSGFKFSLANEPLPIKGEGFLRGGTLQEPRLLFDRTDTAARGTNVYTCLRTFGPYDKEKPEVNVVLMGQRQKLERLRGLVNDLNQGTQIMPGGMKQFFWSQIKIVREVELDNETLPEYEQKSISLTKSLGKDEVIDVALVHVPKTSEFYFDTPYYKVKAILASAGIPCQMVTDYTFANIKWAYMNLATAIYAKAGATPWALEGEVVDFDMVLGLSVSCHISFSSRIGEAKKFMGYANIFDEYGRWLFFEGTAAKPYEEGLTHKQIVYLLGEALNKYKAIKKINPGKIAIHYYKRFSKVEKEAILDCLNKNLSSYKLALVNIDDEHPMRLYDRTKDDGSFPRGGYACLSDHEFLLCTTGFTPLSQKRIGTPKIIHAFVQQFPHPFTDVVAIARQLLGLTKLNYATLTPVVRAPVTLEFAREIAKLASSMSGVEWNGMTVGDVYDRIKHRMWFL